jgi:hypothetical protein
MQRNGVLPAEVLSPNLRSPKAHVARAAHEVVSPELALVDPMLRDPPPRAVLVQRAPRAETVLCAAPGYTLGSGI